MRLRPHLLFNDLNKSDFQFVNSFNYCIFKLVVLTDGIFLVFVGETERLFQLKLKTTYLTFQNHILRQ